MMLPGVFLGGAETPVESSTSESTQPASARRGITGLQLGMRSKPPRGFRNRLPPFDLGTMGASR
jgi:hypothetical protein